MRRIFLLFLLTISFASAEPAPSVAQFVAIALGQEYAAGKTHLRRWADPIKVELHQTANIPPAIIDLIDELLTVLNEATGHPLRRVSESGNVQLYFVAQNEAKAQWRRIAAGEFPADALCAAQIKTDSSGVISTGVILIPADRAAQRGRLLSCVVEELTQITGLVNDSDKVFPSIFNDRSTNQMITPMDWLMLMTLYRPELRPGMSESEVRPIAEKILTGLVEGGELERAARTIQRTELFELLNVN